LILTGVKSDSLTEPEEEEKKQVFSDEELEKIMEELGIKPLS